MKKRIQHNSLFMIELIISILFFLICSSICLQVFIKAHTLTKKSEATNQALRISQNISSLLYQNVHSPNHSFQLTKDFFADYDMTKNDSHVLTLLYDKNWNLSSDITTATYWVYCDYELQDSFSLDYILVSNNVSLLEMDQKESDLYHHLDNSSILYQTTLKLYTGVSHEK